MSEKRRVVIVEPYKLPKVSFIEDSLEGMQSVVGGYIELFKTTESGIDLFCNEEGKLEHLELNRFFPDLMDIVSGNILAIGHDGEGKSVSLTDEQVKEAVSMFIYEYPPTIFINTGTNIVPIAMRFPDE